MITNQEIEEDLLLPILEKLEKREYTLPPLPQIASKVLALAQDPDTDAGQLASLIQKDPILTSNIFQAVNSPLYSSMREIHSVQQAIAWLGLNQTAAIALNFAMQGVLHVRGYEREVRELWEHAVTTGLYAKAIAGQIGENQETSFLCGLLHAIGKPFIVHTVNHGRYQNDPPLPWSIMIALMNQSYVEVGRHLAEAWHFPHVVRDTIMLHRDHTFHLDQSSTKSAAITCLANHLTSQIVASSIDEKALQALPVTKFLSSFPIDLTNLLAMKETIRPQVYRMLI